MASSYAVKDLFYTLQGEGARTGRAAVFLRFTGCNLWSGRERDRSKGPGGCSRWCDTDFVGTDGPGGGRFADADALSEAVDRAWPAGPSHKYVVCTGGEPLLQLDEALADALHARGFEVAVETNGTLVLPKGVDWVCLSPKARGALALTGADEVKLVLPQEGLGPEDFEHLDARHWYLQPRDGPDRNANTDAVVRYCLAHPRWRLSLQTHKIVGIR